jgi:hypothetical protein
VLAARESLLLFKGVLMKKFVLMLLIFLSFSGLAQANSFGIRLGASLGLQYTFDNVFGAGTGLRISGIAIPFGGIYFFTQADALLGYTPLNETGSFNFFYGGGLHIIWISLSQVSFGSTVSVNTFDIGPHGLAGLEYKISPWTSLTLDGGLGLSFYTGSGSTLGSTKNASGIRVYFSIGLAIDFKF